MRINQEFEFKTNLFIMPLIDSSMSLAQTYILASKVRSKLMKEAAQPNSRLRVLVGQANMLDNLMDYIDTESSRRNTEKEDLKRRDELSIENRVKFSVPDAPSHRRNEQTSIVEYEIDSDSESDEDFSESDGESESDLDSESDLSTDSDIEEVDLGVENGLARIQSFRSLPYFDVTLTSVEEVSDESDELSEDSDEYTYGHEHELPELTKSASLTDDEDFEPSTPIDYSNAAHAFYLHKKHENSAHDLVGRQGNLNFLALSCTHDFQHHHQRHDAVYSLEHIL